MTPRFAFWEIRCLIVGIVIVLLFLITGKVLVDYVMDGVDRNLQRMDTIGREDFR